MTGLVQRYYHWLHGQWPAGVVEKLPLMGENGATNLAGVRIVGDLTGIPLLKFSADSGARAVQTFLGESDFKPGDAGDGVLDLAIIGGGVSGYAAAAEARKAGLNFRLFEAQEPFSTIVNFPKRKPIYTYPKAMTPAGEIQFTTDVKEDLLDELREQSRGIEPTFQRIERIERAGGVLRLIPASGDAIAAERVIVAIGRSGNFRRLGVPGEDLGKVFNRLHDPKEFAGRSVLVVGGGDSALETAIALTCVGAKVTVSYRKKEFSRPKPDNVEKIDRLMADPACETGVDSPTSERVSTSAQSWMRGDRPAGSLTLMMGSQLKRIGEDTVELVDGDGSDVSLPNDVVFAMTGREAPLDFFRRSGLNIAGEWSVAAWVGLVISLLFFIWLFHWKKFGFTIGGHGTFLPQIDVPWLNPAVWTGGITDAIGMAAQARTSLLYTLIQSAADPDFYYALAYCLLVVVFGYRRIQRRQTPYVTRQTCTLAAIQILPLFILPKLLLPWMGRNGFFVDGATLQPFADMFFERYDAIGEERAYWRAYGFILAWPLFAYNWFTEQPMGGWLILGGIQTFIFIPLIIRYWGKGAYCGWICSCGALAETVGDSHRHKMPHGPASNRLNMVGQVFLAFAVLVMMLRIVSWIAPDTLAGAAYHALLDGIPVINYEYFVDLIFAGIIGVAFYFHFSGRVWCRFACPLAALMHIYARFSRFRIFADKKKCISCNVCTSVCHQGIDVMNFANKGIGMRDPECVRCSACVQSCPTGVLSFGYLGRDGAPVYDRLPASPVQIRELAKAAHARE
jgi:NosR/NirI family transcriptional regulator, nitrous oxide reductase regulator